MLGGELRGGVAGLVGDVDCVLGERDVADVGDIQRVVQRVTGRRGGGPVLTISMAGDPGRVLKNLHVAVMPAESSRFSKTVTERWRPLPNGNRGTAL